MLVMRKSATINRPMLVAIFFMRFFEVDLLRWARRFAVVVVISFIEDHSVAGNDSAGRGCDRNARIRSGRFLPQIPSVVDAEQQPI